MTNKKLLTDEEVSIALLQSGREKRKEKDTWAFAEALSL